MSVLGTCIALREETETICNGVGGEIVVVLDMRRVFTRFRPCYRSHSLLPTFLGACFQPFGTLPRCMCIRITDMTTMYCVCVNDSRNEEARRKNPLRRTVGSVRPSYQCLAGLRSGLCTILMHTSDSDHKRRYHLHALENKADVEASGVVVVAAERQDIPLESRGRLSALYVIATIRSRFTGARATEVFSLF